MYIIVHSDVSLWNVCILYNSENKDYVTCYVEGQMLISGSNLTWKFKAIAFYNSTCVK